MIIIFGGRAPLKRVLTKGNNIGNKGLNKFNNGLKRGKWLPVSRICNILEAWSGLDSLVVRITHSVIHYALSCFHTLVFKKQKIFSYIM